MIKFTGDWEELEDLGMEYDELMNCYTVHMYNGVYLDVDYDSRLVKVYASIEKRTCYNLDVVYELFQLNLVEKVGK